MAVEVRNSTLCRNTSFENGACKVFVSIRLFAFLDVVFDYLQRVVQSRGCLLVFDRRQYHVRGPRYARSKMSVFVQGFSSVSLDFGSPERIPDEYEGSTLSPGPSSSFRTPPRPLQGSPSVAQLTATRSPNILLSKTRKRQRLENFFQGKARAVYGISPELDSSFRSESSPDGAQRCARGCTEILGHLADVHVVYAACISYIVEYDFLHAFWYTLLCVHQ